MIHKKIILAFFIINCLKNFGQTIENNFQIGKYGEIYHQDSIRLYFNCTGTIISKENAYNYRVGRIDSTFPNLVGEFNDYDLKNKLVLKGHFDSGFLNGPAIYYYSDGSIKAEGNYQTNQKSGIWKYFYPNGQIEKEVNFENGSIHVLSYFTKKGKQKVINGNGDYIGEFCPYKTCSPLTIAGKLLNGYMTGEWKLMDPIMGIIGFETFDNGQFIKGESLIGRMLPRDIYTDYSRIFIEGYNTNENFRILETPLVNFCTNCKIKRFLRYGPITDSTNLGGLHDFFYPQLLNELKKVVSTKRDQWLIVSLRINSDSKIEKIDISSSINDETTEMKTLKIIKDMNEWHPPIVNGIEAASDLYFTILIKFNDIIIPTDYLFKKTLVKPK